MNDSRPRPTTVNMTLVIIAGGNHIRQKHVSVKGNLNKNNVPAFSIGQNATEVIQSVHDKAGMLVARFPQSDLAVIR